VGGMGDQAVRKSGRDGGNDLIPVSLSRYRFQPFSGNLVFCV
jgi:hypothetical protein